MNFETDDILSAEKIKLRLKTNFLGQNLEILKTTDSTLSYLKRNLPLPHGYTVISDAQTEGRGTRGRVFFSPAGGLYMSVYLDALSKEVTPALTTLAAEAVCRALKEVCGFEAEIKPVNDILYCGKKLGGILTEVLWQAEGAEYAMTGIGINIGEVPPEVSDIATSVFEITKKSGYRNLLTAAILNHLEKAYE